VASELEIAESTTKHHPTTTLERLDAAAAVGDAVNCLLVKVMSSCETVRRVYCRRGRRRRRRRRQRCRSTVGQSLRRHLPP